MIADRGFWAGDHVKARVDLKGTGWKPETVKAGSKGIVLNTDFGTHTVAFDGPSWTSNTILEVNPSDLVEDNGLY